MDLETPALPEHDQPGGALRRFGQASLLLLIIYFLSPGPVVKILGTRPPGPATTILGALYTPLVYLNDNVPGVTSFYAWYGGLWGVNL